MVEVLYDSALAAQRADETIESPMRRALRRLRRRKGAVAGLIVILIFVVLAVFAPLIAPFDPAAQSWSAVRKAPSALYWFGTDDVGRDVLSRVIFGTRASLLAGVISVGIALSIGVPLGLTAGLGQQYVRQLEDRCFHRQEAEALVDAADRVQHALEGDLVTGQQLHDPGRRAGLDQGGNSDACSPRLDRRILAARPARSAGSATS